MRTLPYSSPVPQMLGAHDSLPNSYAPEQDPVYEVDLSRVREVCKAIKAIPNIRREEVAHILALLVQAINNTFAWQDGEDVMQRLAEIHDQLEEVQ